ncbi:ABC transporter permease [Henriciella sp.]|uniref:ABC transporter permease n=1 Tax=Henriciella sp. TaxID=1968823 RepID=UPI00263001CC|nr:ABC transporter permease [Henriciella sp.]
MADTSANTDSKTAPVQRVYVPETRFHTGPFKAIRELASELYQFRSHITTLFANDFKSSYRGTVLGVFWNIVLPLVPITVYFFLVSIRVFPSYEGLPPAVFIGFNVMLWYLFTGLITRPISVVQTKAASAMKTSLPLSAAIASSFAQLTFDTLVRFCVIIALVIGYRAWPNIHIGWLMLSIAASLVFCISLGLLLSIVNIVYTDTQRLVTIILQYGLFLSGVIFPVAAMGPLSVLEVANPFCVFLNAARDGLFRGEYPFPAALFAWSGVSVLLCLIGIRFFYVMEHRIRGVV